MAQFVFKYFPDVKVKYKLIDRNNQELLKDIDIEELRLQLDYVKNNLKFNKTEIHYLRGTNEYSERMFSEDFLNYLENLKLSDFILEKGINNSIKLEFHGLWIDAILWETIAMSIINELYFDKKIGKLPKIEQEKYVALGILNLYRKINRLKNLDCDFKFADFGTRRRFKKNWQDLVLWHLNDNFKNSYFSGTSNTFFAYKYGLLPIGTYAHELEMGVSGVYYDDIKKSQQITLQNWFDLYGYGLSILLSDTFTTDCLLKNIDKDFLVNWKGFRHDSGDPFEFTDKIIKYYRLNDIDPKKKMIINSDSLNLKLIEKLYYKYHNEIQVSFGWGTNLTNDFEYLGNDYYCKPLNIVIKLYESNKKKVVKLSDNPEKTLGSSEVVKHYKKSLDII
jgi:nicotinate phosphoribosyltransferase